MPVTATSSRLFSSATVPPALVQSTVRAASSLALAGAAIESVVPATVAALSRGVLRNLIFAKVRLASGLVILAIATTLVGLSIAAPDDAKAGRVARQPADLPNLQPRLAASPKADDTTRGKPVVVRGRVLDPDGNTVAGARIVVDQPIEDREFEAPRWMATSGPDGRFDAAIPPELLDRSKADRDNRPSLAALAPGLGPDWVKLDPENIDGHAHHPAASRRCPRSRAESSTSRAVPYPA